MPEQNTGREVDNMFLKQVQRITAVLQSEGHAVSFSQLAGELRDQLSDASVYVASRKGKLLGHALVGGFDATPFDVEWLSSGKLPEELATGLLKVDSIITGTEARKVTGQKPSAVVPIMGSGRRVGSLVLVRTEGVFSEDELSLAEFIATAIGMVISAAMDEEEEDEVKEKQMARSAIRSLSYSEILAMQHIFDELQGQEGLLVASRIADQAGITRSVIVNALRKLASANVIESRSLGMKGTYLRVLNREIRNELNRQRYPYLGSPALLRRHA